MRQSKLSGLIKKVGKNLGEYFLGTETYRFYNTQKNIFEQLYYFNDIETYVDIKREIKFRKFEDIFSGKIIPTALSLIGFLTIFSNSYLTSEPLTLKESVKAAIIGLTTILLSEAFRLYNNTNLKRSKKEIKELIKNFYNKKP